jgi:hypothetical protein
MGGRPEKTELQEAAPPFAFAHLRCLHGPATGDSRFLYTYIQLDMKRKIALKQGCKTW